MHGICPAKWPRRPYRDLVENNNLRLVILGLAVTFLGVLITLEMGIDDYTADLNAMFAVGFVLAIAGTLVGLVGAMRLVRR